MWEFDVVNVTVEIRSYLRDIYTHCDFDMRVCFVVMKVLL